MTDTPYLQLHVPRRLLLQHKRLIPLSILAACRVLVALGPPTAVAAANLPIALPADRLGVPVSQSRLLARAPTPWSWDWEAERLGEVGRGGEQALEGRFASGFSVGRRHRELGLEHHQAGRFQLARELVLHLWKNEDMYRMLGKEIRTGSPRLAPGMAVGRIVSLMALGGVLGMGKSRTMSSPLPMIPFRRSLDLPLSRSISLTGRAREGSSSGVIIPESSRCELAEIGESIAASLLPPPKESELVELEVGKVAVYPRGRLVGTDESINAAEPNAVPEPFPFPVPRPTVASEGLFVRSIARLSRLGRRVRANAARMGEVG